MLVDQFDVQCLRSLEVVIPKFIFGMYFEIKIVINPSCDLPKEIDGTSEDEESDFEFKPLGSDGMNGFWK